MFTKLYNLCKPTNIPKLQDIVDYMLHNHIIYNKDTYTSRIQERIRLSEISQSITEIDKVITHKYKLDREYTLFYEDIMTFVFLITHITINIPMSTSILNKIKEDIPFLTRCYIRILLLTEGWEYSSIERFIIITFKTYTITKGDNYVRNSCYSFVKKLLNIRDIPRQKGRPKIPQEVKELCKDTLREKGNQRMKRIYTFYTMFTKKDLDTLIEYAQNQSNTELVNKLTCAQTCKE